MEDDDTEYDEYEGEEEGQEDEASSSTTIVSYHTEDFISQPRSSKRGTVPINILEFDHSFGYDCRRRFNLCVADPDTLIFASGNLIHFFNASEDKLTFRRSSTGGGIGHITKNPTFEHVAIGENGINPPIIIYEWPAMEIVTVLREGTTRSYSHLRYSPDGLQLVSQGGDPDYLITIWDWQRSKIALQCKSHGQDVYNVVFSPTMPGHMTSCGSGHIKCWKMASTFTGLKLQGELGRFGKTEISDIVGVYPMPDEKIISGCEWGNILVWDEGLIKVEVRRKKGKPCHAGYISQFEYINGELISIGSDGCINVWYYETIDQAEASEDNHFVEVEPIYEFIIGEGQALATSYNGSSRRAAMLMAIFKQDPSDLDNTLWYAQDGNGGLWLVDLATMQTPKPSRRLLTCHAGPIMDMDVADWSPHAATIGQDGCLHVYNYREKSLLRAHRFRDSGSCVIWLASSLEKSGCTLVCAFYTGVIRMVSVNLMDGMRETRLTQVLKPHTEKITVMSINPTNTILVTGSEDSTVFVFHIENQNSYPNLVPIGYLKVPSSVTVMTWKPNNNTTLFVGCSRGDCMQVDLPEEPQDYTKISYELTECKPILFKFESVKSSILREQARLEFERKRQERMLEKMQELEKMRENDPNVEIDESAFFESETDEEALLPEIYVPEVPSSVLIAFYTTRATVLLSMAGYDAGYTYEYSNPEHDKETLHVASNLLDDSDDEEIYQFLFYKERKYIIFGMERGEIRVCKVNPHDEADFSDYWILPMHDNYNGRISSMRLSYDKSTLLTCGYDGNLFSFVINDDDSAPIRPRIPEPVKNFDIPDTDVPDIEDLDHASLEEVIVQAEQYRILTNARDDKDNTLMILRELTEDFNLIIKRNNDLPPSQRLTDDELELDPRITADLNKQLKAEMDLVYAKLAYDMEKSEIRLKKLMDHFIEPITCLPFAVKKILTPNSMVHSLRELKLTGDYAADRSDSSKHLENLCVEVSPTHEQRSLSIFSSRTASSLNSSEDLDREGGGQAYGVESFLKGLSPETIQYHLGDEINQLLKKYRSLKSKLEEQEQEWKVLQSEKPDPKAVNPEDEEAIEDAKNTIGDYKLKVLLDDQIENRPSVNSKYKQIIISRRQIHFRREDFNDKLRNLRARKLVLQKEVDELIKKLGKIQAELPDDLLKSLPKPLEIDYDVEFPEINLELEPYVPMSERVKESKKKKKLSIITHLALDDSDEEYEVLLMDETRFRPDDCWIANDDAADEAGMKLPRDEPRAVQCVVPPDFLAVLQQPDGTDSKLERDMKRLRSARKIYEQEEILRHVKKSYETFDEDLEELERERLEIVYESVYMDLHLLTMHQELIVLKKFESMENELSKKVDDKMRTKNSASKRIEKLANRIEEKSNYVTRLSEKIKENTARYLSSVSEDKYYIFLKRICKKKYRPPKPEDASSSSSSSSESSSEDDDDDNNKNEGSDEDEDEDTEKVALLHMDEANCPADCERELYEEAFAVREARYEMELRIRDEQRSLELLQKELDAQRKRIKAIELELGTDRDKLQAFLREKQRQLNEIDVTVILKLDQLQLFTDGSDEAENIQNCIVFDKNKLSRLYARVGELEQETAELLEKHKNDKMHLHKIKVECETMKKELEVSKEKMKKEMEQKFGQQVSLVALYEAVLRRLIYDIKANSSSLMKFYDDKIKGIKSEYKEQLQILKDLIQENTEKLSFLTVLEEELTKLHKMQDAKIIPEEEINKIEAQYASDLKRLKEILKNQEKQKEIISRDIRILSMKTKCLPLVDQPKPTTGGEEKLEQTGSAEQEKKPVTEKDEKTSHEDEGVTIDYSEHYKKIIAIRYLLSQITSVDDVNTKETIENMLKEVVEKLKRAGCCKKEIEKSLSEIMQLSVDEGQELPATSGIFTTESLAGIIGRCDVKSKDATREEKGTSEEVHNRLRELFLSVGIGDDTGDVAQDIVDKLKASGDVTAALAYTLQKLPLDTDDETRAALHEHIRRSLLQLMKCVQVQGDG